MSVRTALLVSFLVGIVFGAAAMWLLVGDSAKPSGTEPLARASGVDAARPVATRSDASATSRSPKALSEDLERPSFELAREGDAAEQLGESLEPPRAEPQRGGRRRGRYRTIEFDLGALERSGFEPDDIEWIHERWEQAELEKRTLQEIEDRGEDPPPGGGYSDIERELREDLGDGGYDAMLYATNRDNRVVLGRVQNDSVAHRAGLRNGSVVWSYDGERVFSPKELATLSTSGSRGEPVELVIVTDDGTERYFVERDPLGAELVTAKEQPSPGW